MRFRLLVAATGAAALVAALGTATSSQAAPSQLTARASGPAQVVTVSVPSRGSTVGTLEAWKRKADGRYRRVLGPITTYLGTEGIGKASEYRSRTPRGVFTLTEAFGRKPDPGSHLPYHQVGTNDWWVSDVSSPAYNTLQTCAAGSCPFSTGASEHLSTISVYDYAIVIDYNRDPVRSGAGSAFFLHISAGKATQGCVAVPRKTVRKLLRWLKPQRDPVISIGVGDKAYAPIS